MDSINKRIYVGVTYILYQKIVKISRYNPNTGRQTAQGDLEKNPDLVQNSDQKQKNKGTLTDIKTDLSGPIRQ